jgi:D-alanyl-D-alanine dipeptidase
MDETILMADPRVADTPAHECGEPMRDARHSSDLLIDQRKQADNEVFTYLREGVLKRLQEAQSLLPEGLCLLLVEGHRPLSLQRFYFDRYAQELSDANPDWDAEKLRMATSRLVAPPKVAPHGTGGAVDLTLATADGQELDMGTSVNASPEDSDGACYTAAVNLSAEARGNRDLLASILTAVGFVNYPTEWWHRSYGDRYWALATGEVAAVYAVRPPSEPVLESL